MTMQWKATLSVMLLIISIAAVFVTILINASQDAIDLQIDERIQAVQSTIKTTDEQYRKMYSRRIKSFVDYRMVSDRAIIIESFANRNRNKTFQTTLPFFQLFQKENPYFSTMAYLLPDNYNFLRVNNPSNFGEDVSEMRPDVVHGNRTQQQVDGYIVSHTGIQYAVVQPVLFKDDYIGLVHFGMNAVFILDTVRDKLDTPVAILLTEEKLSFLQKSPLATVNVEKYAIQGSDISLFEEMGNKPDWTAERQRIQLENKTYILIKALGLLSFDREVLANIVVAIDISPQLAELYTRVTISIMMCIGLLLLSFLIVYFGFGTVIQKLEESEQQLRSLINATPDIICFKDGSGRWLEANTSDLELFALSGVEYRGKTDKELANYTDPIYREAFFSCEASDELAWQNKEPSYCEEIIPLPDGTKRIYDIVKVPIFAKKGTRKGLVVLGKDITARERVHAELLTARTDAEEMAQQAQDANRAKSVFLSKMSHELRTPLNAILGYAQLFNEDSLLSVRQLRGIQTIHHSAEHLLMLINDILDLATIEAGKMELRSGELRLHEFFLSICNIIKVRCKQKGLEFRYETVGSLPVTIQADSLRLRQIILNLLSNAVKFTSNGYCLLKVESQPIDAKRVSLTITVEDSGPGVPVNMQTRIFEPFQQTGERLKHSEGTGLGLSISRQIVQLMNGKLTLVSPVNTQIHPEIGPGCSFILSIDVPSSGESVLAPVKDKKVTGYTCKGQKTKHQKILIVDDDPGNRSVLRDTLESLGFITEEVSDGSLVLPACEQFAPDVILMDLRMPEVDGFTATRQLKKNEQFVDIPVIAITASTTDKRGLEKHCLEQGFNAFISKPYIMSHLLEILADHLHITLQYDESSHEEIAGDKVKYTLPVQAILDTLMAFTRSGDIDAVLGHVKNIMQMESGKYKDFAKQIELFAEEFQFEEIESFVTTCQSDK